MYLAIHATTGTIIGQYVGNPIAAFLAGLVSHFLLDVIPHGDTCKGVDEVDEFLQNKKLVRRTKIIALADIIVTIIFSVILFRYNLVVNEFSSFAGLCGAVIPDFLWPLYKPFGIQAFKKIYDLHFKIHWFLKKPALSPLVGLIFQFIIFSLLIAFIFSN